MNKRKIIISVGGSGGHLFPAQAMAREILKNPTEVEILFTGHGLENSPFFAREEFNFQELPSAHLSSKKISELVINCLTISKGIVSAFKLINQFRPDLVIGFGSFHSLPSLFSAYLCSYPFMLYEANCSMGKVNRFFAKSARLMTNSFDLENEKKLKKLLRVQFPLQEKYHRNFQSKEDARRHFLLQNDKFTFLVFGGSQGALSLNTHFCSAVMELLHFAKNFQVIHISGNAEHSEELRNFYREHQIDACVRDFENRMDLAWRAADLAITRAGASTIAEMIAMQVPSILLPFPYSSEKHQEKNASFAQEIVGGALCFEEKDLGPTKLARAISSLVENDQRLLLQMKENIKNYRAQQKHPNLSQVACELAGICMR